MVFCQRLRIYHLCLDRERLDKLLDLSLNNEHLVGQASTVIFESFQILLFVFCQKYKLRKVLHDICLYALANTSFFYQSLHNSIKVLQITLPLACRNRVIFQIIRKLDLLQFLLLESFRGTVRVFKDIILEGCSFPLLPRFRLQRI